MKKSVKRTLYQVYHDIVPTVYHGKLEPRFNRCILSTMRRKNMSFAISKNGPKFYVNLAVMALIRVSQASLAAPRPNRAENRGEMARLRI